jgi:hypothetical protein
LFVSFLSFSLSLSLFISATSTFLPVEVLCTHFVNGRTQLFPHLW